MPKPFFFSNFIRNFTGSGTRFGEAQIPWDRRVDWTSQIILDVLDLDDFPEVLRAWESDSGLTATLIDDAVADWTDIIEAEDLAQATAIEKPLFVPGALTRNGKPVLWMRDRNMKVTFASALPQPLIVIQVASHPCSQKGLSQNYREDYLWPAHFELGGATIEPTVYDLWIDGGLGGQYGGLYNGYNSGIGYIGADSGLDVNFGTTFLEFLIDDNSSVISIDQAVGTTYSTPPIGYDNDLTSLTVGRTLDGGVTAHTGENYAQAYYVIDGTISAPQLSLFYTYLENKWRPAFSQGTFPTFGASDYAEWDAEDITGSDLSSITTNWVDRQQSYAFAPNGNPKLRHGYGRQGGQAIRFDNSVANQRFDCAALTSAHPSTFIVGYWNKGGSNVGSLVDGISTTNRMVMWASNTPQLYAGSSVANSNWAFGREGWRQWAGVFNDNSSELYLDGQLGTTGMAIGTQDNTSGTRIGNNPFDSGRMDGWIEFVYYWDKVLTRTQILDVMKYRGDW